MSESRRLLFGLIWSCTALACGGPAPSGPPGGGGAITANGGAPSSGAGNASGGAGDAGNASGGAGGGGVEGGGSSGMGGGASSGGTDPGTPSDVPQATADAISAFLAAESYKGTSWRPETDAPRERSMSVSPHGRVRVSFNDALVASAALGQGQWDAEAARVVIPHDTGSMVVKEMFDESDVLVGIAAMLKVDGAPGVWAYYCEGPSTRCGEEAGAAHTAENPLFGTGALFSPCGFCHGGQVFTPVSTE